MNALKHGLLAKEPLLPNEDRAAFEAWAEELRLQYNPVGARENELVDGIIADFHRLRRHRKIEAGIFTFLYHRLRSEQAQGEADSYRTVTATSIPGSQAFEEYRPKIEISDPQRHEEALLEQQRHQQALRTESAALGELFVRDSSKENAIIKLSGYAMSIDRSLFRKIAMLDQLQAARQNEHVTDHPA
jgi:hypothetical protein